MEGQYVAYSFFRVDPAWRRLPIEERAAGKDAFAEVIEEMPPPLHKGYAVRIHYITQGATRPPTFICMANKPELAPSYKRFIANRLREAYGFRGTPLRIFVKARKDREKAAIL